MPTSPSTIRRSTLALTAVAFAALLALTGCGDDDDSTADSDDGSTTAPIGTDGDDGDGGDETPAATDGGSGTATLTMADGTLYEFALTSCDTSDTDPASLPLSNGYDVFGRTADGSFTLFLGRAGFDDESVVQSGSLEGGFDEDGKNAQILYSASSDTMDALVVDGATVSGDLSFRQIIPGGPHGADTTATLAVTC